MSIFMLCKHEFIIQKKTINEKKKSIKCHYSFLELGTG
jgi:hypothetical protein